MNLVTLITTMLNNLPMECDYGGESGFIHDGLPKPSTSGVATPGPIWAKAPVNF